MFLWLIPAGRPERVGGAYEDPLAFRIAVSAVT